ncbi:MAG: SDR family NAD(P)-dependent oxidoreductase [Pseudomonadota bacterium]
MRTRKPKTALVTGGASGMGREVALALAAIGMSVFPADLNLDGARETAEMAGRLGGRAEGLEVDVSRSDSTAALFSRLKKLIPELDMVVHAAAVMGGTANLEDITDQDWRRLIAVNLDGTFFCCREAVRWMKETGGGRIVLFSSVAALTPTPGAIGYSAAKGGVNMLARSLAVEAARSNIRVNVIAPGYVETPMLAGLPDGFRDFVIRKTPLKRLGEPREIAGLAAFPASDEADFITGQVLSPNGGLVI